MNSIQFEQAFYQQSNQEYIAEVVKAFKKVSSKVVANTLIQLTHFEIIEETIEIQEFIDNNDVNATVVKKIENWINSASSFIDSKEYATLNETMLKIAGINRKIMKK